MTPQERLARWLDAQACQDVVLRFMGLFDLRRWTEMEACVTPDIEWQRPDLTISGLAHLREVLQATPGNVRVRHMITNLRSTFIDDERVVVDSYFTVYRVTGTTAAADEPAPLDSPASVGRYRDELVRSDEGWRIARRSTTVDFRRDARVR